MKNANGRYKETTAIAQIRDFARSGKEFDVIDKFTQKDEYVCAQCLRNAARSCGYYHIVVSVRKGKVMLFNEIQIASRKDTSP